MEILIEYLARGFVIMLTISMPCVLVAAGVGLVVGVLQAVTQVQEQTIAAAPKILAVFLVLIIGGVGFIRMLTNFISEGISIAFNVVPKSESYVLPPDYFRYTSPFAGEMNDGFQNQSDVEKAIKNPGKVPYIYDKEKIKFNAAPKSATPRPNFIETKQIISR